MNPTAAVGYNTRAQIYLKMGKKDLAESDLKQARKFEKGFD
jgi:Flp pilus assembly protein TadD